MIVDAGLGTAPTPPWPWSSAATPCLPPARSSAPSTRPRWPQALRAAVEAGHAARGAGRIPKRTHAEASTPYQGLPDLS